jgi:hypothetical protein
MSARPLGIAVLAAGTLAAGLAAAPARAQDRTPAPTAAPRSHTEQPRSPARDAYVLSTHGRWMSSGVNIDDIDGRRQRLGDGDFLWFHRSGKSWIVDDPATLARASALFEPLEGLAPEQDALHDREKALDDREQALDDEEERIDAAMERLEPDYDEGDDDVDAPPPPPPSASVEAERDELDRRRGELRDKQRELQAEQRAFAREERALDQREEDLERAAESQLWRLMDELVSSGAAKPAK